MVINLWVNGVVLYGVLEGLREGFMWTKCLIYILGCCLCVGCIRGGKCIEKFSLVKYSVIII